MCADNDILGKILGAIERLDAKHEKLAAQVEALSHAPSPSSSTSPLGAAFFPRPSSSTRNLAGGGIDSSVPPSPVMNGTDTIPCAPAPSYSNGTISPISSPRQGGGIEALRASRGSFSQTAASGASTPYGNLSLAGAVAGGGGPGPNSPRKEEDAKKGLYPSRVVLTTYPSQAGINPIPIKWGASSVLERGPVVCSRIKSNLPIRNSIGAHSGSYSIYRALSIAMGQLRPDWRPDLTNTHPPFVLPPRPGWFGDGTGRGEAGNQSNWRIVSFDPWGAMTQEVWAKEYAEGLDVRPTISQTKAHIKIEELDKLARQGEFPVDGDIVIRSPELAAFPGVDQGVEVNTYKAAIDPVWFLPGVAERLGIEESTLRRALFEDTGGMYPELLTRPDIKVFLPPIGGMTVYIVGDPAKLSDPNTEVTCRPHDSCSGSDVFGSDICTCRPYLIFGIAEAIKCAQRGGVGVIIYFQKEGRALGEVTKYMVYNRRKRGGDSAAEYFNNTAMVAGVKDARHQALMPDVLHFLGITHITNLISMSNLKYDAIIASGITVKNRYEIPEELIPADSRVEIDAKIQSGYFSKKQMTEDILKQTKGRGWEDIVH
ncbi:GTP cyclohydrolase N terminal-domain-containing protein [Naematelia encephala]|uniref:GTP cyclohydrolase N terminal-domain-containing protein n=1 Tax=Naematelia encephala TaxID=71784 RepID=A0A1Y2AWI9_9TREE|nr:GTP cyclohydrolase N terminal-domain-containing protein [Naematelia encephala]